MPSEDGNWLVLAYTVPPEPSRIRVSIWRRLRKTGAVYMDEGVWVLPNRASLREEVETVIREVQSFGGAASAFTSADFNAEQQARIRSRFLAARDEEYAELLGQCERYMRHVDHAIETERYTFAEVEELEEELAKLERWLDEIHSRDWFESPQYAASVAAINRGRQALQAFTEQAFARTSGGAGEAEPPGIESQESRA